MVKSKYFTTPLYYVNAHPHIGHAYTTIVVDIIKKYYAQRGQKVVALTGTDEHGEKIVRMAESQGKTPQALSDEVASEFENTWKKLNLDFDIFYRTTLPSHYDAVKYALQYIKDKGEIEFREYEGEYCVGCERFLKESELVNGGLCPDHLTKPEHRKESNYFFLMSKYQERLIRHFTDNPRSIRPDHYRNEILSFLKEPLNDLCISRPKERLTWGIDLPFDSNFVTYVWVDALTNYLAATGWPDKEKYDKDLWSTAVHLIGKDILKTHAIYWGALLMALDVPLFHEIHVNGFLLMGESKMSKSLGNVVRPLDLEEKYGRDTLRFYLLRELTYGMDSSFTPESYINSVNAYLANGIGNLVSRVLTLSIGNLGKYFDVKFQGEKELQLLEKTTATMKSWNEGFEDLKYQNSIKAWSELVADVNTYINEEKPWALAKDETKKEQLLTVLGTCLQAIQFLGRMIYPVLPNASLEIDRVLGTDGLGLGELPTHFDLTGDIPKLFQRVKSEEPTT